MSQEVTFSLHELAPFFGVTHKTLRSSIEGKIPLVKEKKGDASNPRAFAIPLSTAAKIAREREKFGLPYTVPKVILFGNIKGGTGKTTIAYAMSQIYGEVFGSKVLVVDIDRQLTISKLLSREPLGEKPSLKDLLINTSLPASKAIYPAWIDNVFLLPAHRTLEEVSAAMDPAELQGRFVEIIKEAIEEFNISFVIIDTPPLASQLVSAAVLASNAVFAVANPIIPAFDGIPRFRDLISGTERLKRAFGIQEENSLKGGILNIFEKNTSNDRAVLRAGVIYLEQLGFPKNFFITPYIPKSVKFREMITVKSPITSFLPQAGVLFHLAMKLLKVAGMEKASNYSSLRKRT